MYDFIQVICDLIQVLEEKAVLEKLGKSCIGTSSDFFICTLSLHITDLVGKNNELVFILIIITVSGAYLTPDGENTISK